MKKLFAILLALTLALAAVCALGEGENTRTFDDLPGEEDAFEIAIPASVEIAPDVIAAARKCTIAWSNNAAEYTQGDLEYIWDPDTLSYTAAENTGAWTEVNCAALTVTVVNYSNVAVTAEMDFEAEEGLTVAWNDPLTDVTRVEIASPADGYTPEEIADGEMEFEPAQDECRAAFRVTDGFETLTANGGKIGTVTVTLTFGAVAESRSYWDDCVNNILPQAGQSMLDQANDTGGQGIL